MRRRRLDRVTTMPSLPAALENFIIAPLLPPLFPRPRPPPLKPKPKRKGGGGPRGRAAAKFSSDDNPPKKGFSLRGGRRRRRRRRTRSRSAARPLDFPCRGRRERLLLLQLLSLLVRGRAPLLLQPRPATPPPSLRLFSRGRLFPPRGDRCVPLRERAGLRWGSLSLSPASSFFSLLLFPDDDRAPPPSYPLSPPLILCVLQLFPLSTSKETPLLFLSPSSPSSIACWKQEKRGGAAAAATQTRKDCGGRKTSSSTSSPSISPQKHSP